MREFFKDGKKVELKAIFSKGYVGQVVILDNVSYPQNSNDPLAAYPQPALFTIVEKVEEQEGCYVLQDTTGKKVHLLDERHGLSTWWLCDAAEWLEWNGQHNDEKLKRKERRIELLDAHLSLLRDILVKQGFRVITKEQAQELGIS
jgi:hypothetical protein